MKTMKLRDKHIKRLRERYKDSGKEPEKFILNDVCLTWGIEEQRDPLSFPGMILTMTSSFSFFEQLF